MLEITGMPTLGDTSCDRADELFQQHQQEIFRKTDKLFARLMLFQWLGCIVIALVISPYAWTGESSQIHIHVWAAILVGGAISIFPIWLTRVWPGAAFTRHVIAVAQMLMSALLIGLTGGRIETHFHVFGSLVILSFYRDWRVLIPATLVVALDHFLRGIYWPYSVYGVLTASPWRSIEHAGWVVFEDVFLVISCLRSIREMRFIANRTAALEASDQSSRQIFEEAPIGMAVVNLDRRFTTVNTTLCDMMGYSEEELLSRCPRDITYSADVEESERLAQDLLNGAEHSSVEKRYVRKNSEVLWTTSNACVIRDEAGRPRHFLVMVEDITQRKNTAVALQQAKDEAERANSAKSEFLSRMSHELRTPLNAVLGFGQLLERQNPTETERKWLGHIINAGRHLLDLINEVLDISRIEGGSLPLSLEPVCVNETLQEALDLMRPLAAERAIALSLQSGVEPARYVLADKQRLKQVALNLLTNAVKYTPIGGSVTVSYTPFGKDSLRVSVTDSGAGIAPEKISRLFTPFDRLGAEQSDVEGTGLGLALSRRLMYEMRGSIGVNSVPGHGSTFWIQLPLVEKALIKASPEKPVSSHQPEDSVARKRTILYIEDNRSNITLVEQILAQQAETELITTMHGQDGIDIAHRRSLDLILLDLDLPDVHGSEVLAQLKAQEATRNIPVVVISADATVRQIERLINAGAYEYLTKPLDVAKFLRVVETTTKSANETKECVAA
jgi:two-component system sensor histidine kinase/response regulator